MCLFKDGQARQIVVDDNFPYADNGPKFSKSHGNELWVLLLEKAYAKMYGSYEKIEAGATGKAIRDLTGSPYEHKVNNKTPEDELWKYIITND